MHHSIPNTQQVRPITNTEVTSALDAILSTDKFMASPQMSAFLRYVVEQTLLGNIRRIKAFTVGIEALGKPASFDPQTDPSVRVLAKRLRSSLDMYYQQNPGAEICIDMKPGSYVPKFLHRSEMLTEMPVVTGHSYPVHGMQAVQPTPSSVSQHGLPVAQELAQQTNYADNQGSSAHVSVQRQHETTSMHSDTAEETASHDNAARKSSISQLWQAYKSASKVA